jgi:hypothetical protein
MRVSRSVGLAVFALICLAACNKAAPASAGSQAPNAPASSAPTSSDASDGGDKYACVTAWNAKIVTCSIYSAFGSPISLAGSKQACVSQTQKAADGEVAATIAASCPTEGLIGCCTRTGSPTSESCFYKGPMSGTAGPATCAQSAGVWSAAP